MCWTTVKRKINTDSCSKLNLVVYKQVALDGNSIALHITTRKDRNLTELLILSHTITVPSNFTCSRQIQTNNASVFD